MEICNIVTHVCTEEKITLWKYVRNEKEYKRESNFIFENEIAVLFCCVESNTESFVEFFIQ